MCTSGFSADSLFVRHFFQTPAVRHLAWLVLGQPLLAERRGEGNKGGQTAWPDDLPSRLLALDRNPETLLAHLQQRPTRRLGLYFEQLYGFALTHLLGQRILAQNLPVRLGGRTLGELDFLVADPSGAGVIHHEIAVKYYMGWPGTDPDGKTAGWYGPDTRDQLSTKLQRLREHQLPLWRSEAGTACLRQEGLPPVEASHLGLYGYLFNHYQDTPPALPAGVAVPEPGLTWRTCDQLQAEERPGRARVRLRKPDWLGPLQLEPDYQADAAETTSIAVESRQRPVLVAEVARTEQGFWLEQAREFVVPADWCRGVSQQAPADGQHSDHRFRA